tara:strand:- start:84 stop:440 length:357 start_codon:yes stop_codon:yes gene_type:complete
MVETGFNPDTVGQAGELGPYQITAAYWVDALEHCPELGGKYMDVLNPWYAEWVMVSYWERYAPNTKLETLARIHNGGPNGHYKNETEPYWSKVREQLLDIDPGLIHADFDLRHRDECD